MAFIPAVIVVLVYYSVLNTWFECTVVIIGKRRICVYA